MKILIFGANGFLGKIASKILKKDNEILAIDRIYSENQLNHLDKSKVKELIDKFNPEIILNCIALTSLDFCEDNKFKALEINTFFPSLLAEICKVNKTKLILFSSDYIFSGDNSPYFENSPAHPKSFYGITKLQMEQLTLKINPEIIIIRPSIIYGLDREKDRLFYPTLNALKNNIKIEIKDFRPKYPVFADEVISNAIILAKLDKKGIFNFASEKPVTRLEMAKIIANKFKLKQDLITPAEEIIQKNKPYNVQIVNKRAPEIKFSSFEQGINTLKVLIEHENN